LCRRRSRNPNRPIAWHGFGAGRRAREDVFAGAWILGTAIDLSQGLDLGTGQTVRPIGVLALKDLGIEMAAPWVFDNAILYIVDGVRGIEDCSVDCRKLGRRDKARGALIQSLRIPDSVGKEAGPEVGRRSGDDTIEIGWIPLSLH